MKTDDEFLDHMRMVTDPLVDPLVSNYVNKAGVQGLGHQMGLLFRTSQMQAGEPLIRDYLAEVGTASGFDVEVVERGQKLFELFGPEIVLILASYSLPVAYASGNGVQVIYRSRRLKDDPLRRLSDTAQMVLNVMRRGELSKGGIGERSALKVRLIHSLVRHHVRSEGAKAWKPEWGEPINQEDLAGTLLAFSAAVLNGLRRMGANLSQQEADAYVVAWSAVGRILGVDPQVLPTNEAEAISLAGRIGARQFRPTPEGKELTRQLLETNDTLFPFKGYSVSLMHFFLDDTMFGSNVVEILGLPKANWTRGLVKLRALQKRPVLRLLNWVPGARRRRGFIARHFVQSMISAKRPDGHAAFEVPHGFRSRWGIGA